MDTWSCPNRPLLLFNYESREPEQVTLAEAIRYLKLSSAKRVHNRTQSGSFWQKQYYDRNVRDAREFQVKLRYLRRNPVKRGLVEQAGDWPWSSFRHYALREIGIVEIDLEWSARDRELQTLDGKARAFLNPG